jgi:hypothetical protein
MSGKFCAECLGKDVHWISLDRLADCWDERLLNQQYREDCVRDPYFSGICLPREVAA